MQHAHRSGPSRLLPALTAGALVLGATSVLGQVQVGGRAPAGSDAPVPGAVRGAAAIERLQAEIPRAEELNGMPFDEIVQLLSTDESTWVTPQGRIFFVDPAAPVETNPPASTSPGEEGEDEPEHEPLSGPDMTEDEVFSLHSRPGAARIVYLDFDGHHSRNNSWGHNIEFPPYNTSGSPNTFTQGELNSIVAQWKRAAEDFATFEVDVTTEEPPEKGLKKSGGDDERWGVRVVCTQQTNGFGQGSGGIALLSSYDDNRDNPCFVFNKGNNTGAMTISHEAGHTLGLSHDGLNGSTYHPGTGNGETGWGPIMGAPFGETLVHWSKGDYQGSTSTQNDFAIITRPQNGVPYRADDHPDDVPALTPLASFGCPTPNTHVFEGLIERRNDADTFRFATEGGVVVIGARAGRPGPNIDLLLELYDGDGLMLASDNKIADIDAELELELPAGEYTVLVDGIGRDGRYSDYGSRGHFTVTVQLPISDALADLGYGLAGTGDEPPLLAGNGFACAGNVIDLELTGAPSGARVYLAYGWGQAPVPFMGGTLVPDMTAGSGGMREFRADVDGTLTLPINWPNHVPLGTQVVYQAWVMDAGGPQGFAASNAVAIEVTEPPAGVEAQDDRFVELAGH